MKVLELIQEMVDLKMSQLQELRELLDKANDNNDIQQQIDRSRQIGEVSRDIQLLQNLKKNLEE